MKRWRIRGPAAIRGAALDRCHVLADVLGVVEFDDAFELYVTGDLPDLPGALEVTQLPLEPPRDGTEGDAPILVADDLLVRPPWVGAPAAFRGIELVVPRGGAFGSGEHDSTRAALLALHRGWQPVAAFADVGTGSGILALYAAVRGCPRVFACDVDAAAVRTARELLPAATVVEGGPASLPERVDAIVANLTATELHACLDGVLERWNGAGACVLSGMRAHEEAGIRARLPVAASHRVACGAFVALSCAGIPNRG